MRVQNTIIDHLGKKYFNSKSKLKLMWAVIQKLNGVPFVISKNNQHFGNYISKLNYEIIDEGSKKAMLLVEKTILEAIYYEIQFD